jgi:hypothetical protein
MKENERDDMIKRFELNDTLANYIRQHGYLMIIGPSVTPLIYIYGLYIRIIR